jgi:hypothetical protein
MYENIVQRLKSLCEEKNARHASGIYHHKKEITVSTNDSNRTRLMKKNFTSLCAECSCINKIKLYDRKILLDLWVIRWNSTTQKLQNSYPCNICLKEIKNIDYIKRVFYSDSKGNINVEKVKYMKFLYETPAQKRIRLGIYV